MITRDTVRQISKQYNSEFARGLKLDVTVNQRKRLEAQKSDTVLIP